MIPALLGVGGVIVAGAVAGQVARRRLRGRYPPPGELVDVGGYRLHVESAGTGEPTVVFETGLGEPGIGWAVVVPGVAEQTRAIAYDRAGSGWSDESPRPRTAAVMVDELRALLRAVEAAPPYVLVGQSFGGLVVRLYAAMHAAEVAGMVLVDPAHEDMAARAPEPVRVTWERMNRLAGPMFAIPRALSAAGVFALRPSMVPMAADDLPEAVGRDRYRALMALGGGLRSMTATIRHMDESQAQVRAARGSLGDLPLVVLSAGKAPELPSSIPEEARQANAQLVRQLHRELAELSTRGRLVVAEGSGHMIHHQQPDLVVQAVRDVVEMARA